MTQPTSLGHGLNGDPIPSFGLAVRNVARSPSILNRAQKLSRRVGMATSEAPVVYCLPFGLQRPPLFSLERRVYTVY
jgi:hypothetical protein